MQDLRADANRLNPHQINNLKLRVLYCDGFVD